MNAWRLVITAIVLSVLSRNAGTVQTAPPSISIIGQQAGVTPFISILTLSISDASALKSIQFTIAPTPGSVTRPISATYLASYLAGRGYFNSQTGQITVPIFGLYANYTNNVALTYAFNDGSSQQDSIVIPTSSYVDPCGFDNPIVLQARTQGTNLSYDYILIKSRCSANSPTIIDADGAIRWVGAQGVAGNSFTFFDNAIYDAGVGLGRTELDGTYTVLVANYKAYGVNYVNHNTDYGKYGMILDATTASYLESMDIEVDKAGNVLKVWNLAEIISAAMTAGGDDPNQFIYPSPTDWFHDNSAAYRASDNSIIISSRENFLICLDYDTSAIKWILGDPTKKWYQFPSLRKFALTVAPGGVPPIGQHAPSITQDDNLLVFDNGTASNTQTPAGASRNYTSPRKYQLDLHAKVATEVWNYTRNQSVQAGYCGSVYEDAALNYLVDYAYRHLSGTTVAEIVGLNAAGQTVFDYAYPTPSKCSTAFNAIPLHLEQLVFPPALPTPSPSPTPAPTPTPTPTPSGNSADLKVTVTNGKTSIAAGAQNTYTITLINAGPAAVTGATVSDTFPSSFTGITYTATSATGATGFTASGTGNINDTVNMPSGSKISYAAKGKLSSAATGTLVNTATVAAPQAVPDPNTANNSATDSDTITFKADLKVTVTDGKTAAVAGSKSTYTIVVTNVGPSNAGGAVMQDNFPSTFTGVTYTATGSGGASGFTATGTGNINNTVKMPAGSKITYKATGTISATATGSIADTATVTAPSGVTDPNTANNSVTDTDTL